VSDVEVFVRVGSHRAGHRLERLLGASPPMYFTWETGGCLALISAAHLAGARGIPGITKYRHPAGADGPWPCWPRVTPHS
jgi:hypothetical protein